MKSSKVKSPQHTEKNTDQDVKKAANAACMSTREHNVYLCTGCSVSCSDGDCHVSPSLAVVGSNKYMTFSWNQLTVKVKEGTKTNLSATVYSNFVMC